MPELLEPGAIVGGRYRIRALLGRGGMGVVYEAEHTSLHRVVALKMLVGEGTDAELVLRFLREARSAAQIGHPGIVDVFDLSTPGEPPFLVMERLRGEDLGQRIRGREALPLHEVLRIGADLCAAIAAAHESGIVHRDLKPDNVFLARESTSAEAVVKVLDFGIAKLTSPGEAGMLTEAGSIYGTPAYMAPEQMRSADVDARADIYAIGAILHEALTGAPPFKGSSLPELVLNVTTEPPPDLMVTRPDAPVSLARLIARCLSKRPEERPSSAAELGAELERIARGVPSDAPAAWAGATVPGTLAGSGPLVAPGQAPHAEASAPTLAPGGASHAPHGDEEPSPPTLAPGDASHEPSADAAPPQPTEADAPAKPTKRTWTRRLLRFAGGATVVVLLLFGALYATLSALSWQRERDALAEIQAYLDDDQAEFMDHLSLRMRATADAPELGGGDAVRLYRDLELYLLLTRPAPNGEPALDDYDNHALRRFADEHVHDSELATTALRGGFDAYLHALSLQSVEEPADIWAPRDASLVVRARERLAALPEHTCAWASLAPMAPAESYAEIGAPGLEVDYEAPPLFTREGYEYVGGSLGPRQMCAQDWVLGTRSESSTERLADALLLGGRALRGYRQAYAAEWLRVLSSARWRLPESPSREAVRELLGRVVLEPASPAEQLARQISEQTDLEEFTEPESEDTPVLLGWSPAEREREMVRELAQDFAPLSGSLVATTGLFARHRAVVQELLVITVEVGDAPIEPARAARIGELCARVRALVAVQAEPFRPFFEAMLWAPVALAQSVLLPEA